MKGKRFLTLFACLCVLMAFTAQDIKALDIHVPGDVESIQTAIGSVAAAGGGTVYVAAGIYDSTTQSFPIYMKDGVQLIGEGADVCTLLADGTTSVIVCENVGNTSRIEGFEITNGDAFGGSAIFMINSSLTIAHNKISGNGKLNQWGSYSTFYGTIYCRLSSPTIENNTITGNLAFYGGGIFCDDYVYPYNHDNHVATISQNIIDGNKARNGAGIIFRYCSPIITHNFIIENESDFVGGGIYCANNGRSEPLPVIANNIVAGNSAASQGGGIYIYYNSFAAITNNTIVENSAYNGGGITWRHYAFSSFTNNILADNTAIGVGASIYNLSSDFSKITYTDVWNSSPNSFYPSWVPPAAQEIILEDPLFVDPGSGNYHLQSGSPCMDRGNDSAPGIPAFDIDGDARIVGAAVDLGVDEFTNTPPVADAGPDQVVSADQYCHATVTLDGSGSSDADGDTLTYLWTGPFGTSDEEIVTVTLGLGEHVITLTVSDGIDTDTDEVVITVEDTTPPDVITISATPNVLWPPNHKMASVTLNVSISDNCDPNPSAQIIHVNSNEPENGLGDGDTAPDWEITGDLAVNLRAERSGKGTGRVYTITVRCEDQAGNFSDRQVTVAVPHDQGRKNQSSTAAANNKGKTPKKIKK